MVTAPSRRSRIHGVNRTRFLLGAALATVVITLVIVVIVVARNSQDDTIRTVATEQVPADIPIGIVPDGATDIFGQVASRRGQAESVAVDFTVDGTNRDGLQAQMETSAADAGWEIFERVYDDRQMRLLFLNEAGDTLTVTMTINDGQILAAAVIVRTQ
jgi:hypothetical protein